MNFIRKLYDWTLQKASHPRASLFLALISFFESFIFPIPTDVMIIPMVISKREKFIKISLIAIIFSVLGGLIGYLIGYVFFNEVGIKIFEFFGSENANIFKEKLASEKGLLSGVIILFIAGFTPLPFKIVTISAGFVHFNIILFIIVCFISRGLRFFLVAYLTYKYGSKIGPFLEKKGTEWTIIITGIFIIVAAVIYFIIK